MHVNVFRLTLTANSNECPLLRVNVTKTKRSQQPQCEGKWKSDATKTPFGWAPYQEPSTHTATHSPAGQEEKIWRTKVRKLLGPDIDNLIGERKRKLREQRKKKKKRQRKSLTTSYLQANAQPVTGNYTPHSSSSSTPVFTAEHDTACHRILPLWPVWASRLGLCLPQPVHQPGAEWEKPWCCTGTAQQKPEQWCYQHCSSHMSKTWPRSGC